MHLVYISACNSLPEMGGGTILPSCIMAHAGFRGDGIESGPLYLLSLMGFYHLIHDIKPVHQEVWGFSLKDCDSTAQASGLGAGTTP